MSADNYNPSSESTWWNSDESHDANGMSFVCRDTTVVDCGAFVGGAQTIVPSGYKYA